MWHWLVQHHLYESFIGWCVGVIMTGGVVGLVLRPAVKRVQKAWKAHEETQKTIAARLDPNTPGGLGEMSKVIAKEMNIERGEE